MAVLQRAARVSWWRRRAAEQRLHRLGTVEPWRLHLEEMRGLNELWMRMRAEAGLEGDPPPRVARARERLSMRRWRRFLERID